MELQSDILAEVFNELELSVGNLFEYHVVDDGIRLR